LQTRLPVDTSHMILYLKFTLPIKHAEALVDETNPAYIAGGFQILMSLYKDAPKNIRSIQDR
jgi:hypothetical protein